MIAYEDGGGLQVKEMNRIGLGFDGEMELAGSRNQSNAPIRLPNQPRSIKIVADSSDELFLRRSEDIFL